ncbi:MAG: amidohydrolase family protein [Vicinamibacteria bacterium]
MKSRVLKISLLLLIAVLAGAIYFLFALTRNVEILAPDRPILASVDRSRDPAPTLFAGVRVFNGTDDVLSEPIDVLVTEGRIAAIGDPGTIAEPPGADRIDGTGKTLLPGLIDSHIHLGMNERPPWSAKLPDPRADAAALLYAGVTTVIEAAKNEYWDRIVSGEWSGPRVFRATTMITAKGGHPTALFREILPTPLDTILLSRSLREASGPEEGRRAAHEEIQAKPLDFVKVIYDSVPPGAPRLDEETLRAIIDEARSKNQPVFAHVGSPEDAVAAAEAGASLLMHTPRTAVFSDEQVERIKEKGIPVVTTMRVLGVF